MVAPTTSEVYFHVIEDVVNKVREEFVNNGGPGENVLNDIQRLWEMKMRQKLSSVHDLNVAYEGAEEYETPTAEMLFPSSPLPGTSQTPVNADSLLYNMRTGGTSITPNEFSSRADPISLNKMKTERLHPYMQPCRPWLNQRPGSVDVNVAYKKGREEFGRGISQQSMTQTPLPGTAQTPVTAESSLYNIHTGGNPIAPIEFSFRADAIRRNGMKSGRPSPSMQPRRPWLNQKPVNVAYKQGREELGRGISQQSMTQNFFPLSAGKQKREDFASQCYSEGFIPQQNRASDTVPNGFQNLFNLSAGKRKHEDFAYEYYNGGCIPQQNRVGDTVPNGFQIPQLDGQIPYPYGDFSTPNVYNNQGVVQEDYNIASTSAPHNHARTPAVVTRNDFRDDNDDETLNENDDYDDFNNNDLENDLNTNVLVLAQFDKVKRNKSKRTCELKSGIIMYKNNRDILFKKAKGEFHF